MDTFFVPFNKPCVLGEEIKHIKKVIENKHISGHGIYTKRVERFFEEKYFENSKVLFVNSCTSAVEIMALLLDIKPGDEVIMPSYTFVSTANAFVLRGAKIKFVDIRPETMNVNEELIEEAITPNTKAIVVVHYAGVAVDMVKILEISKKYNIPVLEDSAQGFDAFYKDKPLGSSGLFGCFSFHETKNITSGEGGLLIINNEKYFDRARIIREKGTNRALFLEGMVNKYEWVDIGSNYLASELQAAFLYPQLLNHKEITEGRLKAWNFYYKSLEYLRDLGKIELPKIPNFAKHNAHIFWFKVENENLRSQLFKFLREKGITATFHFIPLHTTKGGRKFGTFVGKDKYTTRESKRLVRLPLYCNITPEEQEYVIDNVIKFFKNV